MKLFKEINKSQFKSLYWAFSIVSLFGCIWTTEKFHFFGLDGQYFKYLSEEALEWYRPQIFFTNSPMQGIGSLSFPYNFLISPIFSPTLHSLGRCDSRLVYATAAAILLLCAIFIAKVFQVSKAGCLAGMIVWIYCAFPVSALHGYYPLAYLSPPIAEAAAQVMLVSGLYVLSLRRGSFWIALVCSFMCFACLMISPVVSFFLAWGFLPLIPITIYFARKNAASLVKCLPVYLLMATICLPYIFGTFLDTPSTTLKGLLVDDPTGTRIENLSHLFGPTSYWPGKVIHIILLGCSIGYIFFGENIYFRLYSFGAVAANIVLIALYFFVILSKTSYTGPEFIYLEFFLTIIYALVGSCLVTEKLFRTLEVFSKRQSLLQKATILLFFSVPFLIIVDYLNSSNSSVISNPFRRHAPNAIIKYLSDHASLKPGGIFRGYTATFLGSTTISGNNWHSLHAHQGRLATSLGNDMRFLGLWRSGIPTLAHYSPMESPLLSLIEAKFLTDEANPVKRNVSLHTKIRKDLLESMGVRYIIANRGEVTLREHPAVATVEPNGDEPIALYELSSPNLQGIVPHKVFKAESIEDALDLMHKPEFSFFSAAVFLKDTELPTKFGGYSKCVISWDQTGMNIRATANNKEEVIMMLPLAFRPTLKVNNHSHDKVQLIRCNLWQTALIFKGNLDCTISYEYGLFNNPFALCQEYLYIKKLRKK